MAAVALAAFSTAAAASAAPVSLSPSTAGISVTVDDATGAYRVEAKDPAWTFAGTIGAPLEAVAATRGRDRAGAYNEIDFRWRAAGGPFRGAIRAYADRPAVLFSVTAEKAGAAPASFPDFTTLPQGLHPFSYRDANFSPATFSLADTATPWMLFDDSGAAAVLSPASDFFVARMSGDGTASIASGFRDELTSVPAGFTHRSLLVLGHGISNTFLAWGDAFRALRGRNVPANDADVLLKSLSYWTDNGADYYYNYDQSKGYAGTLLALKDRYRDEGIPIQSVQLDSWWYQKSRTSASGREGGAKNPRLPEGTWNAYGGTLIYRASPALFPNGLDAFRKDLGLPLIVHGRWIDMQSPYHSRYKISGIAPVDPKWWDETAAYLKASGVVTYEQDWLIDIYRYSPEMASTLGVGEAFTDNMARALRKKGLTVQYCMPTARFFLQGAGYDNLTTIRVSDDRFERRKWRDFFYTSLYARALGIWPWVDVCMSHEPENMLLSTLSAGPVGPGDAIGREVKENIALSARADGVLVKPDQPIVPADATILADARAAADPAAPHRPLVAWTASDHGALRTAYVYAYARQDDALDVAFSPAEFGIAGRAYVYDYFAGAGAPVEAGKPFAAALTAERRKDAYYVVAPVGRSGIALVGDTGKFASMGVQRIAEAKDEPGKLTVTVAFAPGEGEVVLTGFAPAAPQVKAAGGGAAQPVWDSATGRFTVTVSSAGAKQANLRGEPVRLATVVLSLPGK